MREDLGQRLKAVAAAQNISTGDAARLAVERWVAFHDAVKDSDAVAEYARRLLVHGEKLINPYQGMVAEWRLSRTERQIADIASSHLDLEAYSAEVYLVRILTELLQGLGLGDEFITVTNLSFWHAAGGSFMGPERSGSYLAAQERAIRRGMTLYRVFLLSHQQIGSNDLQPHREFLKRVRGDELRTTSDQHELAPDAVRVGYRVCTDVDEAISQFGHFACIRRRSRTTLDPTEDEGCLIVEPVQKPTSLLRLLFSSGPSETDPSVKFYVDRFFQASNGATALEPAP